MAITIGFGPGLADGQLPNAKTVLYTCPASTTAIIRLVTYCATGAVSRTVNLYLKRAGGTSRRQIPKNMTLAVGSVMQHDDVLTLKSGDVLEGDASAAAEVDYTVNGVERA